MDLKKEVTELKKEVSRLSAIRDSYIVELSKRPIEIKASAEIIDPSLHPKLTTEIQRKLDQKERFYCKVLISNENLWVLPIGTLDGDEFEKGEIFLAIIDNEPLNEDLNFNDLIQFQSCDVVEMSDNS